MEHTVNCQVCGKEFTRIVSQHRAKPKHCSRACANKAPGRMTPEIRQRIGRPGATNPNYKGGWKDDYGYIHIGNVLRSHVVWDSCFPNDPIKPGEIIHHRNHIKDDDRIENLEKLSSQSEHAKRHGFGQIDRVRDSLGKFI